MPQKALKICAWYGCTALSCNRYCDKHMVLYEQQQADKYKRQSASKDGYDRDWQRVRLMYLSMHPLCEACQEKGVTVIADLVHHKQELKNGGARLDMDNLMSLCQSCHESIHKCDRWRSRKG